MTREMLQEHFSQYGRVVGKIMIDFIVSFSLFLHMRFIRSKANVDFQVYFLRPWLDSFMDWDVGGVVVGSIWN